MRVSFVGVSVLVLCMAAVGMAAELAGKAAEFRFHRDYVLGTSMDLTVLAADERQAEEVERRVIAEVERLGGILSTYEAESELNRLNRAGGAVKCSPELLDVLGACEKWRMRSGGAFNAQAAQIIDAWHRAEKDGQPPSEAMLRLLAEQIGGKAWEIQSGTARRVGQGRVTVDALAKGYIVDRAVAAARKESSGIAGIMLDIGGDIATWGEASAVDHGGWRVAVADPRHPQENAPAMATIRLNTGAVATSGNYARYFQVGSQRYSHIVDPRTGRPADHVISATVVAADCCTADALATILCVLKPQEGLELIRSLGAEGIIASCLIVDRDGKSWNSPGWQRLVEGGVNPILASDAAGWQNELRISLSIMSAGGRKYRRPYVAVWIEDAAGRPVRTLSVWGNESKYLRELRSWWAFARASQGMVQAVTRASRSPGQYQLVWDGRDDKGQLLPQGTYAVRVESARDKGRHVNMKGAIACEDKAATAKIEGNTEVGEITLSYGPRESKP